MQIRFTMFPLEESMLPIYERLIGCPERTAAKYLRSLLYVQQTNGLPLWFESLPRCPFPSARAKTIRLTIPSPRDEPALGHVHEQLTPLESHEQMRQVKRMLMQRLSPQDQGIQVVPESNRSITPPPPQQLPALPKNESTADMANKTAPTAASVQDGEAAKNKKMRAASKGFHF